MSVNITQTKYEILGIPKNIENACKIENKEEGVF